MLRAVWQASRLPRGRRQNPKTPSVGFRRIKEGKVDWYNKRLARSRVRDIPLGKSVSTPLSTKKQPSSPLSPSMQSLNMHMPSQSKDDYEEVECDLQELLNPYKFHPLNIFFVSLKLLLARLTSSKSTPSFPTK